MSVPGRLSKIKRSQLDQIHKLERKYGDCMEVMHQVMAAYGDFANASDELVLSPDEVKRLTEKKLNDCQNKGF